MKLAKIAALLILALIFTGMVACKKKDDCVVVTGKVVDVQDVYEKDYLNKELLKPAPLEKHKKVTIRYGDSLYTSEVPGNSPVRVGDGYNLCIVKEGDE